MYVYTCNRNSAIGGFVQLRETRIEVGRSGQNTTILGNLCSWKKTDILCYMIA